MGARNGEPVACAWSRAGSRSSAWVTCGCSHTSRAPVAAAAAAIAAPVERSSTGRTRPSGRWSPAASRAAGTRGTPAAAAVVVAGTSWSSPAAVPTVGVPATGSCGVCHWACQAVTSPRALPTVARTASGGRSQHSGCTGRLSGPSVWQRSPQTWQAPTGSPLKTQSKSGGTGGTGGTSLVRALSFTSGACGGESAGGPLSCTVPPVPPAGDKGSIGAPPPAPG
jgi:hypothetical protein